MSSWYDGPGWEVAEKEVLRWGVVKNRKAVNAAKLAGVTPVYVLACVDFYRDNRSQLRVADLRRRLHRAATFREPDNPETWLGGCLA